MRIGLVFAALLWTTACQSKASGTQGSGSGSGSGSQVTSKKRTTFEIEMPVSGKPPVKTTAPLTKAQLDLLAAIKFEDFDLEVTPYPTRIAIRQRSKTLPKISVNIAISHCSEVFKCQPLTLEAYRADETRLKKRLVREELATRPDSIFHLDTSSIGGVPIISAHQAGWNYGKDDLGNPVGAYSHAYTLFYNDDHNVVHVTVAYTDHPKSSLDEMMKVLPRERLAQLAVAFMDAYGQAWASGR